MNAVKPAATEPESWALNAPMTVRSIALIVLAVVAVILMLQYAQSMIIPIVLGVLISYALEPVVASLARWHVPRPAGAAILLLILVGTSGALIYSLRTQANAIVEQLPQGARRLRRLLENDRPDQTSAMQQVQKAATELEKAASRIRTRAAAGRRPARAGQDPPINISNYVMWGSLGVAAGFGQIVLILFLVYLPAGVGRSVPSQARENRRAVAVAEENHGADSGGDRPSDRAVSPGAGVHERAGRRRHVARVPCDSAFSRRPSGASSPACSTRFRTSVRSSSPAGTAVVAFLQFGNIRMAVIVGGVVAW